MELEKKNLKCLIFFSEPSKNKLEHCVSGGRRMVKWKKIDLKGEKTEKKNYGGVSLIYN